MGIRLKIILAFILCFGLMAVVSLSLLQRSVNESYDSIERSDISDNMGRVEQSFAASATSLKNQTSDWAVWNEMYRYVLNPNPDWVKENIGDDALAPADISMAMVFAKNGSLLSLSTTKNNGEELNILAPQFSHYLDYIKKGTKQAQCGIVGIDAGLMLTCWASIVQSDGSGEPVGTVVMGRLLDSSRLSKLREQTKLNFELKDKPGMPEGLTRWSEDLEPGYIGSGEFWTTYDQDDYHLFFRVQDILKHDVGLITLDVPRLVHKQGLMLYQQVRLQLVWTVLVMTALLGLALHFMLIRRLRRFAKQLDVLEVESSCDARIDIDGNDELGLVATNFNKLLVLIKSQMEGLRELLDAKEKAIKLIQSTQAKLIRSEKEALLGQQRVSNLLDNSGEGFLTFGRDLVIDQETSRACEAMLGCSPAGRDAAQVFAQDDHVKADLFCSIIPAALDESDPGIRESMLSLLPAEIARDGILLKAEYKILEDCKCMVVLTDITEEKRLAAMLQREHLRLEFIVAAVSDSRNFFEATDSFRDFVTENLPRILNEVASSQSIASWLYREIHTYKGLLNQFCFINTPKALHEIENSLSALLLLGDTLTRQKIVELLTPEAMQFPFEEDLAVLSNALGKDFLENGKRIILSSVQASQLEKLAMRLLHGEAVDASVIEIRNLLNEIVTLRKVTFKDVLLGFDGLVKQVAKRLEKEVAPIEVYGGADLWIDPLQYQAFLHSLTHVFRNAVVHGLETPEGRWMANKNDIGKIACHVVAEENIIRLTIADDGAGIDLDALRKRAAAGGLYTADEVCNVPDDEIVRLIFRDNMSTKNGITEFSGRGVGLAAVFNETEKLGGEVVVRTVIGQGTKFLFSLPLQQEPIGKVM